MFSFSMYLLLMSFHIGKRAGEQKFYSPKKNSLKVKGCVLIKRALFNKDVLDVLDKGMINSMPSIISLFPLPIPKHPIAYLKYCSKATMLLEILELA